MTWSENQRVSDITSGIENGWIGLFRDPELCWSDGSSFYQGSVPFGSVTVLCGYTSLYREMKWMLMRRQVKLPSVCYSLQGWLILPVCPLRHYYFVDKPLTWSEAQTYCRQKYTDLVTIENAAVMSQIQELVSSSHHNTGFWIGLYSTINWKWSDGLAGSGANYRNWSSKGHVFAMNRFCVYSKHSAWFTRDCGALQYFVCQNTTGIQENRQFVRVTTPMNWSTAQAYCRENYADLVTVTSADENQQVWKLLAHLGFVWLGLFRDPELYWSDGSSFSWSNFIPFGTLMGWQTVLCAFTSVKEEMQWRLKSCEARLPFVCYSPHVTRQVVKLRIELDDSSVDLNNPAVKEELLKKLQARLEEDGVSGAALKWRQQPDGKVFHKEEDEGNPPAC
nr:PREDICTED: C-type mannose receptor 2-like [Stegastes partitus]